MKLSCTDQRIFRLPQFVCGTALLLLAFWPSVAPAQQPLSWPNRSPYVRVTTGEVFVLMPKDAARAMQRRLKDVSPEDWGVERGKLSTDTKDPRRWVRLFTSGLKAQACFLVTRQSWILLNDQSVASLNEVLEQEGRDLVASGFDNEEKRQGYLDGLDGLEFGMCITLDDRFIRLYFTGESGRADWLQGQEKSADALLELCHNVAVTRQGEEVTFTYNRMRLDGSVVQRAVHARVAGRRLELLRLETIELRKAGTFSYPALI